MELRICAEVDDEGQALQSLYRWILQDPDVRRDAAVGVRSVVSTPGDMGGAFDAITVLVSNAISLSSLIVAYMSWRDSRPKAPKVSIERDGLVVSLTDCTPETLGRVVAVLSQQGEP